MIMRPFWTLNEGSGVVSRRLKLVPFDASHIFTSQATSRSCNTPSSGGVVFAWGREPDGATLFSPSSSGWTQLVRNSGASRSQWFGVRKPSNPGSSETISFSSNKTISIWSMVLQDFDTSAVIPFTSFETIGSVGDIRASPTGSLPLVAMNNSENMLSLFAGYNTGDTSFSATCSGAGVADAYAIVAASGGSTSAKVVWDSNMLLPSVAATHQWTVTGLNSGGAMHSVAAAIKFILP